MIQKKIYSYEFPYYDKFITFTPGTPVSIDHQGHAFPGAGTTIYRNITAKPVTKAMKNLKVRELPHHMLLAVYNGGVTAFKMSFEGFSYEVESISLPPIGSQDRLVNDVIPVDEKNEHFIIIGRLFLLPLTVKVDRTDDHVKVSFAVGQDRMLPHDDDEYPHVDSLSNDTFALIYENGDKVIVHAGEWKGEGADATLVLGDEFIAGNRYDFHGIAGMDSNHFIIATTGRRYPKQEGWPSVQACLCTIGEKKAITVGEWVRLPWSVSENFFDMDNMGPSDVVIVYAEQGSGAVQSTMLHFDREHNQIFFGSQRTIQNGGAVTRWGKMDIRVLSPVSFAVFYEDQAVQGLMMVLCGISPSLDIVVISPTYVIDRPWRNDGFTRYDFDLCAQGWGNFMIGEYREVEGRPATVQFHRGVVIPRMFGIAQSAKKGKLTVQFAGMFKVPGNRKLTPGRAIYTNSKGELIEGAPFGYVNRNFGIFYEFDWRDNSILSNNNLVGIAVTKKKIYMKYQ